MNNCHKNRASVYFPPSQSVKVPGSSLEEVKGVRLQPLKDRWCCSPQDLSKVEKGHSFNSTPEIISIQQSELVRCEREKNVEYLSI